MHIKLTILSPFQLMLDSVSCFYRKQSKYCINFVIAIYKHDRFHNASHT